MGDSFSIVEHHVRFFSVREIFFSVKGKETCFRVPVSDFFFFEPILVSILLHILNLEHSEL